MKTPHSATPPILNGLRVETLATRLSSAEMRTVEAAAEATGITRSEWLRDAALAYLNRPSQTPSISFESTLLAEIMGLRSLVLNLFPAAIPGFAVGSVRQIMAYADSVKHGEAAKILRHSSENQVPE